MKKRLEKKIEKMRRKKIHEALEMVLEINTTHPRDQKATGNKPTAFFEFSGHVAGVDIVVDPDGWCPMRGSKERWAASSYVNRCGSMDRIMKRLANKKKELQDAGKM